MGLEANCLATWQGTTASVRTHLDSDGLDVRGGFRLHLNLSDVRGVAATEGIVRIRSESGLLELHLGNLAAKWERAIRSPKTRAEKLGVKPGSRVLLVRIGDADLEAELLSRNCVVQKRAGASPVDVVFLLVRAPRDLGELARYKREIVSNGVIWVVRVKGAEGTVSEAAVRSEALGAGLIDVKVVAYSSTHSALKLVIPVAQRN